MTKYEEIIYSDDSTEVKEKKMIDLLKAEKAAEDKAIMEKYREGIAKQDIMIAKKEKAIEQMKAILKKHDIKMSVGACDCCESPWIGFEYKGKKIMGYQDLANFDMFEDEEGS